MGSTLAREGARKPETPDKMASGDGNAGPSCRDLPGTVTVEDAPGTSGFCSSASSRCLCCCCCCCCWMRLRSERLSSALAAAGTSRAFSSTAARPRSRVQGTRRMSLAMAESQRAAAAYCGAPVGGGRQGCGLRQRPLAAPPRRRPLTLSHQQQEEAGKPGGGRRRGEEEGGGKLASSRT